MMNAAASSVSRSSAASVLMAVTVDDINAFYEMTEKKLRGYADYNSRAGEDEEAENLSEETVDEDR